MSGESFLDPLSVLPTYFSKSKADDLTLVALSDLLGEYDPGPGDCSCLVSLFSPIVKDLTFDPKVAPDTSY